MSSGWLALQGVGVMVLGACYSPNVQRGVPCGQPGDVCPIGQDCIAGFCDGVLRAEDGAIINNDDANQNQGDGSMGMVDAPLDAPPYTLWGGQDELTSLETAGSTESNPSVTSNKLTVVFTAETGSDDEDIYLGTRSAVSDTFTHSLLAAVNAAGFHDTSPEISGDGQTLYLCSNRSGSFEVYRSTFSGSWSSPVLQTDLSSASPDGDVAISPDGLTAAVVRLGTPNRIFLYTRASTGAAFGNATEHPELNVTTDIAAPTITNNADVIYFHAGAVPDLYYALRMTDGTFAGPWPVPGINSTNHDRAPFVLQGDNYLIWDKGGDMNEASR